MWRTGANEAAEITFYQDTKFGGKTVKAGTYALHTIPGAKEWTIVLNSNLNQWGSYFYDKSADVARVTGKASTASDSVESFSIAFSETEMAMGWGTTRVTVPYSAK